MLNKGFLYATSTAIMFATMGIFTKFAYNYDAVNANTLFFSSSLISCLFFLVILLIKYKNFSFLKINKKDLILSLLSGGLFGLFLANLSVLKALQYVDVSIQKIITYSNPLFIALINLFIFKDKLTKQSITTILLMIIGLFLVVGKLNLNGSNIITGIIFAILSSLFVAVYSVSSERSNSTIDYMQYWFFAFLGSFIYASIYMLFIGELSTVSGLFIFDIKLITLLLCIAVINFALPYITFYKAIATIGAEKTGIILTMAPVLSIFLSVVLLNEKLTMLQILGAGLILLASILSGKE